MARTLLKWFARGATIAAAALAAACSSTAAEDQEPRFPTSRDFPASVMQRMTFEAAVPEQWRLSALHTPDRENAPWRIVVITGTPSWAEYWAPTIARIGEDREMIVVDRPGFAESQPQEAVPDIAKQAEALAPLLDGAPGQRVLLVGQSFGAPIAALMAQTHPGKVSALVLASSYFGDRGPTARRLFMVGGVVQPLLGRDLRNSISEVRAQRAQLPAAFAALRAIRAPIVFVHGDADTFVDYASTERIAQTYHASFIGVPGGDHFLNACCVDQTIAAFESAIAAAPAE